MEHWIPFFYSCCCSCLFSSIRHQVCEGTISRSKCPWESVTSIAKSKTRAHGFVFYFCCHIKEYRLGLKILDAQKITFLLFACFLVGHKARADLLLLAQSVQSFFGFPNSKQCCLTTPKQNPDSTFIFPKWFPLASCGTDFTTEMHHHSTWQTVLAQRHHA